VIGSRVSKVIGWNTYNPDNAAYLACFLDAAISATAPAEDAEAEIYESASVVATVTSHVRDRPLCQGISVRRTIRAFAIITKETGRFLRDWKTTFTAYFAVRITPLLSLCRIR